jgi:hypothetical protein
MDLKKIPQGGKGSEVQMSSQYPLRRIREAGPDSILHNELEFDQLQ